jgi:hypothetical protein
MHIKLEPSEVTISEIKVSEIQHQLMKEELREYINEKEREYIHEALFTIDPNFQGLINF